MIDMLVSWVVTCKFSHLLVFEQVNILILKVIINEVNPHWELHESNFTNIGLV